MPTATVNGVNLAYRVEGKGVPLVLVHGFATSSRIWDPVLADLAEGFQVFAYDHRGHGDSDKPEGPYQIQTFVDDLVGFLDHAGLDRIDLVGHSMGGRTALLFALEYGERLERLLLVGASGAAPQGPPRERFQTLRKIAAEEGMEAVFRHDLVQGLIPATVREEGPERKAFRKMFMKNTPAGYCAAIDAILSMPDLTRRLGEIHAPTWVCAGEQDAGPLAFSELCMEHIPGCARAVIPACGHYPMQEAPEAFIGAMWEFLEKTSSS